MSKPQIQRYAVVDDAGTVVNIIMWDGVSPWTPPEGCTVRLATPADTIPQDQDQ